MSDSPKYPYCIHCDAPVDRIDYSAKLETFDVKGGTVITYVKVSAYCRECGMELYVPEINDMNKLSRDNAYAAAMKQHRVKGQWIYKERHEHYPSGKPYTARYCGVCGRRDHNEDSDYCGYCGAEMKKEKQDEDDRSDNKIDNEDCLCFLSKMRQSAKYN